MPVTINGTTGIAGPDGSASTPAVQGTDSNTGLFFPAANEMAITANGSVAANFPAGVTFGFKNRIINGGMVINQRGFSGTPASLEYTLDRWRAIMSTVSSKYTVSQNAGSVTPPAGFTYYLGVTSSSAYSVGSADQYAMQQWIEGYNIADLAWGTANAVSVTLSFWVRSSLTGTFGGALGNSGGSRSYPFSYTISSANTWTKISVTVAGDTSGTWLTDNSRGISVLFNLGSGSTYSGTANTWAGTQYNAPTGATSVVGTNGATWYITGVQLEIGTQATAFDWRPYGTELMLCQRYYFKITPGNGVPFGMAFGRTTSASRISIPFPVTMRSAPTALEQSGTAADYNNLGLGTAGADITCSSVPTFNAASVQHASVTNTFSSTVVVAAAGFGSTASATAFYAWSAEL